MNIVVLVKQVPDTYSERKLSSGDHTLDRDVTDAVLDEIDERALESVRGLGVNSAPWALSRSAGIAVRTVSPCRTA